MITSPFLAMARQHRSAEQNIAVTSPVERDSSPVPRDSEPGAVGESAATDAGGECTVNLWGVLIGACLVWAWIASGILLYRDAELRGANAVGWLIAWLFGWVMALVVWLVVRPPRPDAV